MEHSSHPDICVRPQYQLITAGGLHQLLPSSQDVWAYPLTCPASTQGSSSAEPAANFQQSQQYHWHDRRQQESVGAHDIDLIYNASTQAPQNGNPECPSAQHLADKFAEYKLTIRIVFQSIKNGRLDEASRRLSEASEWLLGNVEDLGKIKSLAKVTHAYMLFGKGLHKDDDEPHCECRKKLWGDFNTAWLAFFQKQMDTLMGSLDSGQGVNLVSQENIYKMVTNLTIACDGIEKHGLIDYEYGVEESRIIQGNRAFL